MRIAGDKWELLKGDYSAALLSVDDNGVVKTNNNFGGTSFTSTVNGQQLVTLYGNAMANEGATGAGLYFSQNAPVPTITPCRGSDFGSEGQLYFSGQPSALDSSRFIALTALRPTASHPERWRGGAVGEGSD